MNRIDSLFAAKSRNILSVYYPAGFPNFDDTIAVAQELERRGVDMIEIGIPFSDPMADGVVIQEAATKALKGGITLRKIFDQLKDLRQSVSMPAILMGYLNPIMQFGFEPFCQRCNEVGIDGVIIPDLPYKDYIESYKSIAESYGVEVIMLITPETSEERIRLIDSTTSGFIYMVSTASVTGAKKSFADSTVEYFERVEAMKLRNPRLIGFGISNPATLNNAYANSNGAIIGSHFVKLLDNEPTIESAVDKVLSSIGL